MNTIEKAFIFSGGKGKRLGIYKKNNVKAFAKINSKKLLLNHIDNLNKFLKIKKIFVIITEKKFFFENELKDFDNVEILENSKDYSYKGILNGLKLIKNHVKEEEKFITFLADEYFEKDDFKNFCNFALNINKDENLIAVKKFDFPHEYFKNYSVILNKENEFLLDSFEKNNQVVSEYFGTGLMCLNYELFKLLENNLDKKPFYSLLNQFKKPLIFELKNYININTKVDIYNLQKKIVDEKKLKIDVVIPAYKEEANISYVVRDFKKVCRDIIVACKKSDDKTEELINQNNGKLISGDFLGYGHAIKEGIKNSDADIIVLSEADGTFRSSDVKKFVTLLSESDLVIGTRTNPSYIQYGASMGFLKRFFNVIYGKIITLLWLDRSVSLTDVGCTLRAFWRHDYLEIENNLKSHNAAFAPEHTIEFIQHGFRVIEIPVNYYPRTLGVSKISGTLLQSAITALKMMKVIILKRFYYFFNR
jgi:GTP:adenosylcobinamide-phosphate guanylyltransferase